MGKSQSVTIGHRYYLGLQSILNFGRLDAVRLLRFKEKIGWAGSASGGDDITVDQEELFGGKEAEGGVSGTVTVQDGNTSQTADAYLTELYQTNEEGGKRVPAFRAVSQLIFKSFYWGNNPFFPAWDAVVQRVHYSGFDGAAQWYPSKAAINSVQIYDSGDAGQVTPEPLSVTSTLTAVSSITGNWPGFGSFVHTRLYATNVWPKAIEDLTADDGYQIQFDQTINDDYRLQMGIDLNEVLSVGAAAISDTTLTIRFQYFRKTPAQFGDFRVLVIDSDDNIVSSTTVTGDVYNTWTEADPVTVDLPTGTEVCRVDFRFGNRKFLRNIRVDVSGAGTVVAQDMNPAHIIRECLTDQHFGRRVPDAEIDDTTFQAVADTLHAEGFGLSLNVDFKNSTPDDVIGMVERHCDIRHYTHRSTGKHTLKAIRDDYVYASLPAFTYADVTDADVAIETLNELPNTVTLKYWDWTKFAAASISDTNHAKAQVDGGIDNEEVEFLGITQPTLAGKVLARELRASTVPKLHGTIVLTRAGYDLHPGDAFVVTDSRFGLAGEVLRVIEADIGDLTQNRIIIKFVQDAFDLGEVANITGEDQVGDNIATTAAVVQNRVVQEAPYYSIARAIGDTDANAELTDDPTLGFIQAAGLSPGGTHLSARIQVDDGPGYVEQGSIDFAPGATLTAAAGAYDTTLSATSTAGMDVLTYPVLAQIGDELIRIDSKASGSLTVGRGCFDTIPAAHASGDKVIVLTDYAELVSEEYNTGDTPDVKLQSVTGSGALALADAPADTITMANRAIRPYPPGQVKIAGSYTPTELNDGDALTWVHRDRLTQTSATILDHTGAGVGPEASTIYRVDFFPIDGSGTESGTAYFTTDGSSPALTGTSFTLNEADYKTAAPATARQVRIKLTTERDGYDSWQSPSFVLPIFDALQEPDATAIQDVDGEAILV